MTANSKKITVAVVQAAPVLFNRQATIEKACDLTSQAAQQGAQLVLFPEAFVPAYPRGLSFGTVVGNRTPEGRKIWQSYWENTVEVPGPTTQKLGEAARKAKIYLAMGVIERDVIRSKGTLYCTLLYFGPDGQLLGKHQKKVARFTVLALIPLGFLWMGWFIWAILAFVINLAHPPTLNDAIPLDRKRKIAAGIVSEPSIYLHPKSIFHCSVLESAIR